MHFFPILWKKKDAHNAKMSFRCRALTVEKKDLLKSWHNKISPSISRHISIESFVEDVVSPFLHILSPQTLRPVMFWSPSIPLFLFSLEAQIYNVNKILQRPILSMLSINCLFFWWFYGIYYFLLQKQTLNELRFLR